MNDVNELACVSSNVMATSDLSAYVIRRQCVTYGDRHMYKACVRPATLVCMTDDSQNPYNKTTP